jgi:TonB-linked SusC/RagA family outer membrane protein
MVMKLTFAALIFCTLQVSAHGYAQKTSISGENISLAEAFKAIEQQTGYLFFYDGDVVQKAKPIKIHLKDVSVDEALSACLRNSKLTYSIINKTIVIQTVAGDVLSVSEREEPTMTVPPPVTIKGRVVNRQGEPVQGVSVVIAGTKTGTVTDKAGMFSINVTTDGKVTLEISSVGFVSQSVQTDGEKDLNITLEEADADLSDIVVVGYGTQKKSDLVGSVAQINAKKLNDKPVFNVGQGLQGKISGVQVVQQAGGKPGGDPMIRIRGTNSINTSSDPLFVVDGIIGVKNALSTLNPEDIVTMDVLKDASATAIYGARGANGVIMITTKRGVSGKTQVDYNGYVSRSVLQRHLYTLDADQLMYVYEQAMANGDKYGTINRAKDFRGPYATSQSYSEMPWLFEKVDKGGYILDLIGKDGNYYKPIYNTNWEEKAFRPATSNSHHIDLRGGGENAKFSMSLGYSDQRGLMEESYFKRYSGRVTGDVKITQWLDMSTNISYNRSQETNDDGITRSTAEVWGILPVQYPNDPSVGIYAGRWGTNSDFNVGEQWYNIVFRRSQIGGVTNRDQTTASIALNAKITPDLSLKTDFSIDYNAYKYNYYSGKLYGGNGSANINTENTFYWQNQYYFNYDKRIADVHKVNAMVGLAWTQYNWENLNTSNSVFFSNFYEWHNIGAGAQTRPVPSSSDGKSSLNSYFARLNYVFDNKYMLTATGRIDGSSKFGPNTKYGFFPSAGIAWRISQEDFMQDVGAISELKLRGSVGKTGNQEIGSYVSQTYVGVAGVVLGSSSQTGIYPSAMGNPDLRWESTTQYDGGLEIGLFDNRLNLTVDYYYKVTKDMLLDVPLPRSTTTGTAKMNYGSVENKGWEFGINGAILDGKDLKWNADLSVSLNHNEILALGPTGAPIYVQTGAGNGTNILQVGAPIGSFFGLTRLGTYSTEETSLAARYGMLPGDLKFLDRNDDGKIDLFSDGGIIGRAFPKVLAGFNHYLNYRRFDASLNIQVVLGVNKAFVHESAEDRQLVSGGLNSTLQAWRPTAQNSMIAQMRPGNGGAYYQSYPDTHMISDAAFVRGAGATIGYTFPVTAWKLQKIRAYLSANNFFLITDVEGYDPEGSSIDKKDSRTPNIDKYQYPNPAIYSFGVNVSF